MEVVAFFVVVQGMYTQYAESLWTRITEHVSNIQYSIKLSILGVESFNSSFHMRKSSRHRHFSCSCINPDCTPPHPQKTPVYPSSYCSTR